MRRENSPALYCMGMPAQVRAPHAAGFVTGAFNLGLLIRTLIGVGTPRGLQGLLAAILTLVIVLWTRVIDLWRPVETPFGDPTSTFTLGHRFELLPVDASEWAV